MSVNQNPIKMKEKINFRNVVAETLLIPLSMRARESRRSDAILRDPLAVQLTESIDYDYSKFGRAPMSALGCVIRSSLYDRKVQEFIRCRRNPVVVNVGCGLDTRFQRIADRDRAAFYELDLPEVIDIRERLIPAPEGDTYVRGSALETGWMDRLRERHPGGDFIFTLEGVAMYFREEQVREIFANLARRFPGGIVCVDFCGPKLANRKLKPDSMNNVAAEIRCGVDDGRIVEQWVPQLELVRQWLYMDFARRRWGLTGVVFRLFPKFTRKFSSLCMYKIRTSEGHIAR